MENKPLISVIVPVYKAEEYLDRCFQSILDQTCQNIELILVDDGSPGNSGAICDAWAERDSRVVVIHKENGGTGQARNAALDRARGDYISFVDCDDYVSERIYDTMLSLMDEQTDVVECEFVKTFHDQAVFDSPIASSTVYTAEEAMLCHIRETCFRQIVWNKLYRRSAIGDIRFVDGMRSDDEFFTYRVIGGARRLVHCNAGLYAYRQREGSVMRQKYTLKRLEVISARMARLEFIREHFPKLEYEARFDLYFACMTVMQGSLRYFRGDDLETARKEIYGALKEITPLPANPNAGAKKNALLWLSQRCFEPTCRLMNLLTDLHILT